MKKFLNKTAASLLAVALSLLVVVPSFAADPQWTATSSGASKNANAGYIAPFGRRIVEVHNTGAVKLCFERVLGDTGSINVTLTTYNAFNVAAGTHYTALSGTTLSWADGVVGVKCTTLTVSAMPTGPGIIGIDLGGYAFSPRVYALLNNGTLYPNATYVAPVFPLADSSGDASGSGTVGSPYKNPSNALLQIKDRLDSTHGRLLYFRGGTYRDFKRYTGENEWGINVQAGARGKTAPLIIMPYPGEAVTIDQNYGSVSSDGGGYGGGSGFFFRSTASDVFIIGPFDVTKTIGPAVISFNEDSLGNNSSDVVIYKVNSSLVKDTRPDASNVAAFKTQFANNWIFQDNTISWVYSNGNDGGGPGTCIYNPYDSTPLCLGNGFQSFNSQNLAFIKNTIDGVAIFFGWKGVPDSTVASNHTMDISHNLFLRGYDGIVTLEGFQYLSSTGHFDNSLIRYNVADNPSTSSDSQRSDGLLSTWRTDGSSCPQNTGFQISNNIIRNAGSTVGNNRPIDVQNVQSVWVWNNIFEGSAQGQIGVATGDRVSKLEYSDYNNYSGGTATWVLPGNTYSSLGAWQGASNSFLARSNPDANAQTLSPSYTNAAANDYRITSGSLATAGRFGRPIGVGNETVGALSVDHWDGAADLSLSATAIEASAGLSLFHLTLSNAGPANASAITISTTLPGGAVLVTALSSSNCTQLGQTVTCTATALANGTSIIFTIAISASATQPVNLSFNASSNNNDTNNGNNTTTITATLPTFAELFKVQQFLLSRNTLTTQETQRLDVFPASQGDGVITFSDWWLLQQIILGSK